LDKGLELGQKGGYLELLVAATILEARLRRAKGDLSGAVARLQEIYETLRKADEPLAEADTAAWLSRMQAEMDGGASAVKWIETLNAQAGAKSGLAQWMIRFSLVRLLMTLRHWEEAMNLTVDLENSAAGANSVGRQIEALMLQAEIHWQSSEPGQAFPRLCQSIELVEPRGFLRLFLDEGICLRPALASLLKWPALTPQQKTFTARLLADFPTPDSAEATQKPMDIAQAGLVDPLSEREIEVLRMLVRGLTLAEIAKQLYLSPNTLKAHTQNIYSKLDVHSRVDLANKARELGLIP
jgi:LuxR family maltose regulon positive regulatory protein